jgi:toxin ParE1/3/4
MSQFRIQAGASQQLDEIHAYTRKIWGQVQADRYIHGLFDLFQAIAERRTLWRPVPAEFGVTGYFCRYEKHFIYWKLLSDGSVGIVTILHERMHQMEAFRESPPI